jgi:outer membrane protein OmpA-like peptidoglycan-associated protein
LANVAHHAGLGLVAAACLAGCAQVSGLETRARILSEPPCTDFFFPIYFAAGSAELSRPAQKVVANAGRHVADCTVAQVEVVGLADYKGPAVANLALSRRRAERVAGALTQAGRPARVFHLSARGEGAGGGAPLRRRADVFIRFQR